MNQRLINSIVSASILLTTIASINAAVGPTKWGIVGAGKISHDFAIVVNTTNRSEHEIIAIASRNLSSAHEFARQHNISKAYGSYEELSLDADVQVVYVGVIHPAHFNVSVLMMEHRKHLLVEKPLAMNAKEVEALTGFAKAKKVFLMEALWTRVIPGYRFVVDQIRAGVIGDVYFVSDVFGIEGLSQVERLAKRELGGGTVLDIGVYVINVAQMAFGDQSPVSVRAVGHKNADNVDDSMSAILEYANGRLASITTHGLIQLPNEGIIAGTKGTIKIVSGEEIYVNKTAHRFPYPAVKAELNFETSPGLRYEFDEVRQCLIAGKLESDYISHKHSLTIAKIEDEIRRQVGVTYDVD